MVRVDSAETLLNIWISMDEFLERILEKLGDIFEALMTKPVLVQVRELLLDAQVAGSCWQRRSRLPGIRISCGRWVSLPSVLFQGSLDCGYHVLECLIDVRPLRYRAPILGRCQEFSEWQIVPVARPQ